MRTLLAAAEPEPEPAGASVAYWPLTSTSFAAGYSPSYSFNVTFGGPAQPAASPDPYRTTAFVGRPVPEITA